MSIDTTFRVRVAPHTLVNIVGGESYLVHLVSQETFHLSTLGTRIWDLLIRSDSIERALAMFTEDSDLDSKRIQQDLLELLEELQSRNFIEFLSPNPPAAGRAGVSSL